MAKAYGVVYYIVNTINGKMYVGQTKNFKKRIKGHEYSDQYIDRAIKKYSWENFRCGVIKSCDSKAEMDKWEKFFIIALNTKKPIGYNLTDGGEGTNGLKPTPEHCVEMSIVRRNDSPYKNLIAEIEKQKLTYAKLAKLLKLVITSVSAKMLGRLNFTENQISKLVEIFGKPAEYLFARDDGLPITLSKYYKTHYKNLLNEIEKRKLTYKELAKVLGFAKQTFSNKMLGKKNFTERDKAKLAEIFGKPIDYLMFKEEF